MKQLISKIIRKGEAGYIPPAVLWEEIDHVESCDCEAEFGGGYVCTRAPGHRGPHAAHGAGDVLLAVEVPDGKGEE